MKLSPITKSAKLPYEMVKGSISKRDDLSRKMANDIVDNFQQHLVHGDITLANCQRVINESKPKRIYLEVDKNEDKTALAAINILSEDSGRVSGYAFDMHLNDEGKVTISELPTIAHEMQHFADFMYHPKIVARYQTLNAKNLYTDKFEKFYDDQIYIQETFNGKKDKKFILKDIKHNVKKFLRGHSVEDKIDYLQYMRYNLEMEDKSFRTQQKVAKKLYNKKFDVYEDDLIKQNDDYMFQEKIQLLKDMTAELIKKERGKYHAKLKKANKQ